MRHDGQIGFIVLEEPACTVPFTTRAGGVRESPWRHIRHQSAGHSSSVITLPFGAWWGSVGRVPGSAHHASWTRTPPLLDWPSYLTLTRL